MAAKNAEFLFPGHGPPMYDFFPFCILWYSGNLPWKLIPLLISSIGADRVKQALIETAQFLESIGNQALDGMNQVNFFLLLRFLEH